MSEQSVTLLPARVTTVSMGMAAGTTIYNGDAVNAVWISANPTPGAGQGMRIGPKGSLNWTTSGAQVFGAVDTGVTDPVTLTLSSNVSALVNPVDIGVAVATQLIAQGIPSVFLGDELVAGNAIPNIGGNVWGFQDLDVSRYASIVVFLSMIGTGPVSATFTSLSGKNLGSFDFPASYPGGVTFTLPVTGPKLSVTFASSTGTYTYAIHGSNRPVTDPRILNGWSRAWQRNETGAMVAGTRYNAPTVFTSNGKPAFLRMVTTGAGVCKFGYLSFDAADALMQVDIVDSAVGVAGTDGKEIEQLIILPPGRLQLYIYSTVTAAYTVVYTIAQQA